MNNSKQPVQLLLILEQGNVFVQTLGSSFLPMRKDDLKEYELCLKVGLQGRDREHQPHKQEENIFWHNVGYSI